MGWKGNPYKFFVVNPKERAHWEDLDVDRNTTLKLILK
jgi:hypothetical protein